MLYMASLYGVETIGDATLGFGLPGSCLVASRDFSLPGLEFCVVVGRSASVSGVVSGRIPGLVYDNYRVLCQRCDTPRRFASIVLYLFPKLFLAWFGVLCRRRESRNYAMRLFFSVVCCGFRSSCSPEGILSRRRDPRRRFANVMSCGFPTVMNLESTSALRRSASFFQRLVASLGLLTLYMES
jgi:hypothetical protein